ncbi:hypothetical protein B0H14DRAFT_2621860 [Mycena olivaceomarginata]|nr:hypothetical protein B0H14DRAFT_2621860 [Mycena olivaceomarginata]
MANSASLAVARERRADLAAAERAQSVSKLQTALRSSSPLSSLTTLVDDHEKLHFPESDTPMEPSTRQTRSAKRKSDVRSDLSESDEPPKKPAKNKPGPKPKAKEITPRPGTSCDEWGLRTLGIVCVIRPSGTTEKSYRLKLFLDTRGFQCC